LDPMLTTGSAIPAVSSLYLAVVTSSDQCDLEDPMLTTGSAIPAVSSVPHGRHLLRPV
ncbi:hypothetical protein NFI96_023401, partial [Prochilodus magdalenae]